MSPDTFLMYTASLGMNDADRVDLLLDFIQLGDQDLFDDYIVESTRLADSSRCAAATCACTQTDRPSSTCMGTAYHNKLLGAAALDRAVMGVK